MSSLAPNASAEEVQDEIAFTIILLETLDPDSDSYWQDKVTREAELADLQSRLDALQRNMAGPSYTNGQSTRPSLFQPNGSYQQFNEPASLYPPTGARKRPRTLEDTLAADHANKSSRTTPSPSATTPGTSSSNDSFPELFETWPPQAQAGGVRQAHSSLNHVIEPQRQSEAQAARARAAEQARQEAENSQAWNMQNMARQQYQQHMQHPPPPQPQALPSMMVQSPPMGSHSQNGTSSRLFNRDGPYQVPLRASHQSPPFQRSTSSQSLHTNSPRQTPQRLPSMHSPAIPRSMSSQSIKTENSRHTPLRMPPVSSMSTQRPPLRSPANTFQAGSSRPRTNDQPVEIIDLCGDSDSDSDIQEVTPWQNRNRTQAFGNSNGFPPRQSQQTNGYASSGQNRYGPVPNAFQLPSTGGARTPSGQSIYGTLRNSLHNPMLIDDYDDYLEVIENPSTRGNYVPGGPSGFAPYLGSSQRQNPFPYSAGDDGMGYMPGSYPGFADPGDIFNRQQDWHDRYGGSGQHNQDTLNEELRKLLGNVRPDDDIPPELRLSTPEAMAVSLMEHQKLGVSWMKSMEEGTNKGSILADEMGLGKTVQALSLIVSRPSEDPARKTTLVVAPVALMRQWEREIKTKVKGGNHALRVITYHGSKKRSFKDLREYDVVLTSFGTVASEYSKKERIREFEARDPDNPDAPARPKMPKDDDYVLLGKNSLWYRIILDEAHNIRNKETKTSKACCELQAIYRLCMTGTPMMNRTDELYGLVRFLRIQPYCEWGHFRRDIKASLEKGTHAVKQDGMRKLQALLKAILLRRTQESKIDGKVIFELPEKKINRVHVSFDAEQQAFYNALESKTQLKFNKYLKAGTVGKQYSHILVLLLRLRQACCHPHLLKDFAEPAGDISEESLLDFARQLGPDVVERIKAEDGAFSCPICLDGVENPAIFLPCGHNACTECFARITSEPARGDEGYKCPNCRGKLDPKRITDYYSFKKVHMPDAHPADDDESFVKEEAYASSDSESYSDNDGEEDDLNGFIVPDDVIDGPGPERPKQKPKKSKGKEKMVNDSKGKEKMVDGSPKQKKTLAQLRREAHRNRAAKRRYFRRLCKDWVTSAKVDRTIELVRDIKKADPTEKTLIFSQFTSLLDILELPLAREQHEYTRLDGSMSVDMRNDAVNRFIDSPSCNVLLVSLKAGNAGLNLNAASQVIILDPFWNPYVEYQAIGRAHRLGQTRPVTVHRILVPETVEDRIMELQRKKEELITMALDENAGRNISRLGVQELSYLFGVRTTMPNSHGE